MTVICVDDHPILLRGLKKNIQQILPDADVNGFFRSEEALSFARDNGCDVLLCEIEMYGSTGLLLADEVQKINPLVNIIFVTVCDEKEYAREVMRLKPSGYILKPADKQQLARELENLRYQ